MRHLVAIFSLSVLLVSWSGSAAAAPILYTFTGTNNLAGGFILDDAAAFAFTTQGEGLLGVLSSPIQTIWGTYGVFVFEGTPSLFILDQPAFSGGLEVLSPDHWIVRSVVSGPEVDGLTPIVLNLFMYTSAAGLTGASLTPPAISPNAFDFQYTFAFSDGSFDAAPLVTLTKVSEPSTLLLLGFALCGLCGLIWQRSKHALSDGVLLRRVEDQ